MASFDDLSPELLEEIMLWLPSDSLKKFKLVQKSWYFHINALVVDPIFVAKHLSNMKKKLLSATGCYFYDLSTLRKKEKLEGPVVKEEEEEEEEKIKSKEEVQKREGEEQEQELQRLQEGKESEDRAEYLLMLASDNPSDIDFLVCDTDDLRKLTGFIRVASQCDGIICLFENEIFGQGTAYLMNPSIQEMRIVDCSSDDENYVLRGVGFGHDSRVHDYKVVALYTIPEDSETDGPYVAKVYSLSGNFWREIEFNVEEVWLFNNEHQEMYHNGVCYWYYEDFSDVNIVSFDFSDEVFRYIPVTCEVDLLMEEGGLSEWTKMAVWKQSVVLFTYPKKGTKVIDMWVLDIISIGVEDSFSWTKQLTIGPLEGIKRPLGFLTDDLLYMEAEDGIIKIYHRDVDRVSQICKPLEWFCNDLFLIYQSSLVSVLSKERRRLV